MSTKYPTLNNLLEEKGWTPGDLVGIDFGGGSPRYALAIPSGDFTQKSVYSLFRLELVNLGKGGGTFYLPTKGISLGLHAPIINPVSGLIVRDYTLKIGCSPDLRCVQDVHVGVNEVVNALYSNQNKSMRFWAQLIGKDQLIIKRGRLGGWLENLDKISFLRFSRDSYGPEWFQPIIESAF